jgi:hypothetical protein
MRRIAHTIHTEQSTSFMHSIRNRLDIMDSAQDIAHMSARYKPRLLREQRLEVLGRKFELRFWRDPPLHGQVETVGHVQPGLDVGLVLHFGEDDFIARGQFECVGKVHEVLGCGGAEDWGYVSIDVGVELLNSVYRFHRGRH